MKFHILVFGCQMNYADSARIKAVMKNCGFDYSPTIDNADIVIFDTCSVRQKAEDKITGKLKDIPKDKKIRLTGCMVQHNLRNSKISKATNGKSIFGPTQKGNFIGRTKSQNPEIIGLESKDMKDSIGSKIKSEGEKIYINHAFNPFFVNLKKTHPNLELCMRIDDVGMLPLILKKLGYEVEKNPEVLQEYNEIFPLFPEQDIEEINPGTAYIPISTGCNQFCSYCIVPYARGLEKYYSVEQVVEECKKHLTRGVQELVLIGQIVNKHPEFNTIIKEVLKLPNLKRLRYTSPYPTFYNEELFQLHENETKLCPHIHIPVQSGSNNILKKMFRGYTIEEFKTFIDAIQKLKRKISITTDIIVGFPDETEEDFQKSLEITNYSKFDMIYIGIYSPRRGTYAEQKFADNIPYKTKYARREQLNNLLTQISAENNAQELGQKKEVLIDNIFSKKGKTILQGHTDNMKTIEIEVEEGHNFSRGDFLQIEITKTQSLKIFGKTNT